MVKIGEISLTKWC